MATTNTDRAERVAQNCAEEVARRVANRDGKRVAVPGTFDHVYSVQGEGYYVSPINEDGVTLGVWLSVPGMIVGQRVRCLQFVDGIEEVLAEFPEIDRNGY